MMKKLKILIANDDGIRSEGIARLAKAASEFGDVWVAAPEHQCSGMSVRLTIAGMPEMAVYRYDFPVPVQAAWSVDGTPADCVKVALHALLDFRPDVVLSGVNDGMNAGHDVCYSGTVALRPRLRSMAFTPLPFPWVRPLPLMWPSRICPQCSKSFCLRL